VILASVCHSSSSESVLITRGGGNVTITTSTAGGIIRVGVEGGTATEASAETRLEIGASVGAGGATEIGVGVDSATGEGAATRAVV
jgi:hypothetical protein